jgi:glycosyltransferase involved in cell wall biosynthesis
MKDRSRAPADARTRVAIVTDAWLVGGGAERVLFTLLTGLDRARFEPVVFSLFSPGTKASFCDSAEALGIPVVRYDTSPRRRLQFIAQTIRFFGDIKKGKFEAVHGSGDGGLALIAGRLAGVRVRVSTIHDVVPRRLLPDHLLRVLTLRQFATTVVAVSSVVANFVREHYGVSPAKVAVIFNGVDDAFLVRRPVEDAATSGAEDRPRRLVTIARLDAFKGVDVFLDAAALVIARYPDLELHIVGGGPLRASLEQQAGALGIAASVTFHGLLTDVAGPLLMADIFALTSRSEGLGVAAIEAMAASKPVVASAVGGLSEVVVDGETGFLIRPRRVAGGAPEPDREAIAEAILRLLGKPDLAQSMGRAGRLRYEDHFTARAFASKYEALYTGRAGTAAPAHRRAR